MSTLLVAEHLARRLPPARPNGRRRHAELAAPVHAWHDMVEFLREAKERYGRYWRKSAREPGAERELAEMAIERLEKLQLVEREAGRVAPAAGARPLRARRGRGAQS